MGVSGVVIAPVAIWRIVYIVDNTAKRNAHLARPKSCHGILVVDCGRVPVTRIPTMFCCSLNPSVVCYVSHCRFLGGTGAFEPSNSEH